MLGVRGSCLLFGRDFFLLFRGFYRVLCREIGRGEGGSSYSVIIFVEYDRIVVTWVDRVCDFKICRRVK